MQNSIKIIRILLPKLMNINIIGNYVDTCIEFFVDESDYYNIVNSEIIEDNNFAEYWNEDNTTTYLYKKSGTYEEIKTFYEDIISGKFFDFDLSECKIDII